MQQVFKNALYHREPKVLECQLRPLCCGHLFILMAADNPYVVLSEIKPTLIHLAFAVGICSRTFDEATAWMKSEDIIDDVKAWGKRCRKNNFRLQGIIFEKYLRDFSAFPVRWSQARNPEPTQHPWPLLIATSIMPLVGEERAWNMPLPMAASIWSASKELSGDRNLKTDWEYQALEQMRETASQKEKELKI